MTYNTQEVSRESGQPVELYEFSMGVEQFSYNTSESEIVIGAVTYPPLEIERSKILLGAEQRQDVLTVRMPAGTAPANKYTAIVPGEACTLTIKRQHTTDTPTPQTVVIFKGILRSVSYEQDGRIAELAVVPLTSGLGRDVPRFTYQGLCNHILYDGQCTVSQSSYKATLEVTIVSDAQLTIPGLNAEVDGFYTGGFIQFGTADFRLILKHVGNVVDLLLPFPSNVLGQNVDVFAGCDHTIGVCKSKFDNVVNYGGFAFVPLRNVFSTGID